MKDRLYPLLFKSGIKKDGTPFQGEYCTDGQWVRWQRGNVRKIGRMLGANVAFEPIEVPEILPFLYITQVSNNAAAPNLQAYIAYDNA